MLVAVEGGAERLAGTISYSDESCSPGAHATNLAPYLPLLREQIAASEAPSGDLEAGGCGVGPWRRRDRGAAWTTLLVLALWARRRAGARRVNLRRRSPRNRNRRSTPGT